MTRLLPCLPAVLMCAASALCQPATRPAEPATQPAASATADEVVVTATRLATPLREVGSAVTVIDAAQIERRGAVTVADALRDVPGVNVVSQGALGQVASVFIRGAKSEHTKVLIDGVCVNDTIAPAGGFNWANLRTEDVERIEVVRGPQSVLYGSDAIGGVIHIITKRGKGKPSGSVRAWGGSFDTYGESLSVGGAVRWLDYHVHLSRLDSGGISAAADSLGNKERDPYRNTSFSTKLGLTPTDNFETIILLKGLCATSEVDDGGGRAQDDPQREDMARQLIFRVEPRLTLLDGRWEQMFAFSYTKDTRTDNDWPVGDRIRSEFHGERTKFEWQHNLHLHKTNTLTVGLDTEEEAGSSTYFSDQFGPFHDHFARQTLRTCGYYVQDKINLADAFFLTAGARMDEHEEFGQACTWRLAPAVWIERTQTKLKGAVGTGFKAPTIYQLHAPFYGNMDLDPERSVGWEAGFEQYLLNEQLGFEAVYFANRFEDLIDFVSTGYRNVNQASSCGAELNATWKPCEPLELRGSYTYTQTRDEETGDELIRRPRQKFSLDVNVRPMKRLLLRAGVSFVGGRDDLFFDPATFATRRVRLAKYQLWSFGAEYELHKNLTLFGRVENAFNESYEEVFGYGTPGAAVYAGVKASF